MPPLQTSCLKSWSKLGHEVKKWSYEDDANSIVPLMPELHPAIQADIFRYKLLYEQGGWWLDCDVFLIKHLPALKEITFASERQKDGSVIKSNMVIYSPPKQPLMKNLYEKAMDLRHEKAWAVTGPKMLIDIEAAMFTPNDFCPIDWWDYAKLNEPMEFPDCYGIHCWNQLIKNSAFMKRPKLKSLLYKMLKSQ